MICSSRCALENLFQAQCGHWSAGWKSLGGSYGAWMESKWFWLPVLCPGDLTGSCIVPIGQRSLSVHGHCPTAFLLHLCVAIHWISWCLSQSPSTYQDAVSQPWFCLFNCLLHQLLPPSSSCKASRDSVVSRVSIEYHLHKNWRMFWPKPYTIVTETILYISAVTTTSLAAYNADRSINWPFLQVLMYPLIRAMLSGPYELTQLLPCLSACSRRSSWLFTAFSDNDEEVLVRRSFFFQNQSPGFYYNQHFQSW